MDDPARSRSADLRQHSVRIAHVAFESNGGVAELREEVATDEAVGAGDENRPYRSAVPSSLSRTFPSSRARR
jgi:hypothetical protein